MTSELPKVLREWFALQLFASNRASRHNCVQFVIFHLARWLCTRRFSEPTFRPSGATKHGKNTVSSDLPTFWRICTFSLLVFSLLDLLSSDFLPGSAFPSVHVAGNLTSKLLSGILSITLIHMNEDVCIYIYIHSCIYLFVFIFTLKKCTCTHAWTLNVQYVYCM